MRKVKVDLGELAFALESSFDKPPSHPVLNMTSSPCLPQPEETMTDKLAFTRADTDSPLESKLLITLRTMGSPAGV